MTQVSQLPDEELVKYVREVDKQAYLWIIRRYEAALMRYANHLTQDKDKAADAVQETFIKAFSNLQGFDIKRKFSSWIYRIAHNESMNVLGKEGKHMHLDVHLDLDSGTHIEDVTITKEVQSQIHQCLGQLPLIYRESLSLYYLEEKSYEEISDILRIPVGTVGTRINRAKLFMKKLCQHIKP